MVPEKLRSLQQPLISWYNKATDKVNIMDLEYKQCEGWDDKLGDKSPNDIRKVSKNIKKWGIQLDNSKVVLLKKWIVETQIC